MPAEDAAPATMVCGGGKERPGGTDGLPDVCADASGAPLNILLQEDQRADRRRRERGKAPNFRLSSPSLGGQKIQLNCHPDHPRRRPALAHELRGQVVSSIDIVNLGPIFGPVFRPSLGPFLPRGRDRLQACQSSIFYFDISGQFSGQNFCQLN